MKEVAASHKGVLVHKQDLTRSKCVWLNPSRSQRDDALQSLRSLAQDPLSITAVGRPSQAAATEREEGQFNEVLEAELERRLAAYKAERELLALSYGFAGDDDAYARELQEKLVVLDLDIERRKQSVLTSFFVC